MAFVNGRSNVESLDAMARVIHLVSFALGASHYYEWVQSASNWADEISREGMLGKWAAANGFSLAECSCMPMLLGLPCYALVNVAGCL